MDTAMEEEFEVIGTVEEVSGHLFVVSANIKNENKFLWCLREKFFVQGLRYGESLYNVLELFMLVNLIVKTDEQGDFHVLVAWVGDKPEIIEVEDKRLHPVYGKKGNLAMSNKDGSLVVVSLEGDYIVSTRKDVIYLDGFLLEDETKKLVGQLVSFDAVPLIRKDASDAIYAATCVWFGLTEPRIVDRFRLHESRDEVVRLKTEAIDSDSDIEVLQSKVDGSTTEVPTLKTEVIDCDNDIEVLESPVKRCVITLNDDVLSDDDIQIIDVVLNSPSARSESQKLSERAKMFETHAVGTVAVIPNEVLALVDVFVDDDKVKVMVFRNSFGNCYNIRDILKVGDSLCLLLRSADIFGGSISWFVVKAYKGNCDPKRLAEMMLPVGIGDELETKVQETVAGSALKPMRKTGFGNAKVPLFVENVASGVSVKTDDRLGMPSESKTSEVETTTTQNDAKVVIKHEVVEGGALVEERAPVEEHAHVEEVDVKVVPVFDRMQTQILKPIVLKHLVKQYTMQDVVLNGSGRLRKFNTYFVADMQLLPVKVLIPNSLFYTNGRNRCLASVQLGIEVSFDAVKLKKGNHSSGATHRAILSWQGAKPAPQTILTKARLSTSGTNNVPFRPNTVYVGFVIDVPLLDCCIVKFGTVPVLVQSKNLLVDPWTKDSSPVVISDYLKFGDHVALTCKLEDNCVVADVCGALPSYVSLFGAVGTFDIKSLNVPSRDVNASVAQAEKQLFSMLRCSSYCLESNVAYKGVIVEFPYRNYAIAIVGEIRVLVHVDSVASVKEEGKREKVVVINQLLSLGSSVLLWVDRKSSGFESYYSAREVRLVSDVTLKSKLFLKNFNGFVQDIKRNYQNTIELRGCRVDTDLCLFRMDHTVVPRVSYVSQVKRRLRLFASVRVNATVSNGHEIVVHSVVIL